MTVEREAITGRLLALGNPPAWGVVPPMIYGGRGYRPGWAGWPRQRRVETAQALLRKAGYGPGHPLRFEIRFNSDPEHRRIALALLDNWRALPVEARLLNTEATLHFASLRQGDFDLARSGWIGDLSAPENFLEIYRNGSGLNYSGYRNPAFDRLLEKAMQTSAPGTRTLLMRKAEALLMADAPVLPVHHYVTKNLVGARVQDWQNNLANIHPSRSLRLKNQ
jgi:peptide/nickel transport system substrate-binding protein/oligopeptide transport system substrate-binding protein